jgi:dCMP deaminase
VRPSKIANYMEIAETVAKRSHDSECQVGAVLVNNKSSSIVSTGYNGFVRGADDSVLPTTRPEKYEFMLHAETNLINNCARNGISMNDCTLICTMSPCKSCLRQLVNCGITKVIVRHLYKDYHDVLKMPDVRVNSEYDKENNVYEISYSVGTK